MFGETEDDDDPVVVFHYGVTLAQVKDILYQKKIILKRKLEKAIKHLPIGCRTVFVLHDIEGLNHKEIAERLNLAEGTSKSQLFKARATLRKILGQSGIR